MDTGEREEEWDVLLPPGEVEADIVSYPKAVRGWRGGGERDQ